MDAKVGMMDANVAAKIMYADDKDADLAEKAAQFAAQSGTEAAAARGYVDSVIEPASARKQLLYAFEMLYNKCEYPIGKETWKHLSKERQYEEESVFDSLHSHLCFAGSRL